MPEFVSSDTQQQYDERGYGNSVGLGETPAILIIDFQRGLTEYQDERFPFAWNYDSEVQATARLIAAARGAGAPVVYAQMAYERGGVDGGVLMRKIPGLAMFEVGSTTAQIDPRIEPEPSDYIVTKKVQSAFFGTVLSTYLTARGVDTVLVAGCTTSGCVRATVTDCCSHGFRTVIVPECIGDQAPEPHNASLFDMRSKNADVVSVDDAVAYMNDLGSEAS